MDLHASPSTLGVLMIVKNEAKHLAACLDTVAEWVDEIVIVDSGSTDDTETIARQYTDKFYRYDDWPGFGPQRQRAQQHMTTEWVLALDADERVTPELKAEIQQVVAQNQPNQAYLVNRLSDAFGKTIHHSGWSPDWVLRLYRRQDTRYNDALVHEKVLTQGLTVNKLNGRLLHFTYDHLHHYLAKTTGYLKAWTDEREGKKKAGLGSALVHAFASFFKMYILKRGFLDGRHGFILAWLSMHSTFVKYIDLWLRDYQKERNQ
ncbi:glycosyltransferase family 2 protein [Photobacterium atrarenae]|uniref:Glycosyltransferase family 2 protein n=1 Tax=Photobacterium atrarenae TaxID=865757 RepID=A0ABY5GH28_9GAMM|nr:glycosyltransferase family 2 protein [Photobacterium atrarenae]UTV27897.1 glycosyltransferase family 2 protein [Photobacterium atrarenae]